MLAFFLSPFGRLLAVGIIAFTAGGTLGWRTQKKLADGAMLKAVTQAYRQKVATLEDRVKQTNAAAKNDQDRAAAAEAGRKEAEDQANALQARIVDGVCLSDTDAGELRRLWDHPAARKPR